MRNHLKLSKKYATKNLHWKNNQLLTYFFVMNIKYNKNNLKFI